MNLTIHRGANEIGGSCVEVAAGNTRILLDFGMPLGNGLGGEFAESAIEGKSINELIEKKTLYPIVLVQRELDNFALRLREYLAFGKEVFLGIGAFWITIARECSGRPI